MKTGFTVKAPSLGELEQIGIIYDAAADFQAQNGIVQWEKGVYPSVELARDALEKGLLYGFYLDGALAGTYILNPVQGEIYDAVAWGVSGVPLTIHAMAVAPGYHGKGVAFRAMMAAERIAHSQGQTVMRVDTNSANRFAQTLFIRCGYRFVCPVTFPHRKPPYQTYYCYEKKLER